MRGIRGVTLLHRRGRGDPKGSILDWVSDLTQEIQNILQCGAEQGFRMFGFFVSLIDWLLVFRVLRFASFVQFIQKIAAREGRNLTVV